MIFFLNVKLNIFLLALCDFCNVNADRWFICERGRKNVRNLFGVGKNLLAIREIKLHMGVFGVWGSRNKNRVCGEKSKSSNLISSVALELPADRYYLQKRNSEWDLERNDNNSTEQWTSVSNVLLPKISEGEAKMLRLFVFSSRLRPSDVR